MTPACRVCGNSHGANQPHVWGDEAERAFVEEMKAATTAVVVAADVKTRRAYMREYMRAYRKAGPKRARR